MASISARFSASLKRVSVFTGFAAVVIVLWALLPETFMTARNLLNVFQQISMLAVVAMTMTIVMAMGDFDLSVGSMASLAGVVAAFLFTHDQSILIAVSVAMLVGLAGGLLNGFLVSYAGIIPFVATLGTLTIFSGLAFIVSAGKTIFGRDIPAEFGGFARGGIPLEGLGLEGLKAPSLMLLAVAVLAIVWFVLERKVFGRHLYVIGSNTDAARLSGIPVKKLRLIAFALTGVGAAMAGLMLASRVASANPTQGAGLMLDSIACVFLGMTLHRHHEPHVIGTLAGVVLLGLLDNGLTQLSVDSYIREVMVGSILIVAVGLSRIKNTD